MSTTYPPAPNYNMGWAGEAWANAATAELKHTFVDVDVVGAGPTPDSVAMWAVVRKVFGRDPKNIAQQAGDCVGWGARNACQALAAIEITSGDPEEFHLLCPSYLYAMGRRVGGWRLRGDGSTGSWQAAAVKKYGVLRSDYPTVPTYSGKTSKAWGRSPGPPADFVAEADDHLVNSTGLVKDVDQAVVALANGYPITVASSVGYEMKVGRDGFHRRKGSWAHQMAVIGYGKKPELHFIIQNSWGDVHGQLIDFATEKPLPVGCLRVKAADFARMLKAGDSHAYSRFDGFEAQPFDWGRWMMI